MSKSVIQSEEEIKQRIVDCLKDVEWDIIQGKTDAVMTKLEEAQKLAQEWGEKKILQCVTRVLTGRFLQNCAFSRTIVLHWWTVIEQLNP